VNIAAKVTFAAGASTAMIHAPKEIADFAHIAGAFTIKMRTLQAELFALC